MTEIQKRQESVNLDRPNHILWERLGQIDSLLERMVNPDIRASLQLQYHQIQGELDQRELQRIATAEGMPEQHE